MKNKIYLYTPWCEQGLSYDAKAIEKIAIDKGLKVIITFDKKRKIQWACTFEDIKNISNTINDNDIFFCFERMPQKYLDKIAKRTTNMYLMINYEYYERSLHNYYLYFNKIFCKSKKAYEHCLEDNLSNVIYLPWILWNFPITDVKQINEKIKVIFNGGTGGYKDRRNLESIINLLKDYNNDTIEVTIKLTNDLRRWTKKILKKNLSFINQDSRITLIQDMMDRTSYINFLKNFDINLCPSKYEGFGLTLLEGLHSRLASITIDQSPMNEIVIHNENGLCVNSILVDKIRHQGIYNIDRNEFYKNFKRLVESPEIIMSMKGKTINLINSNEKLFNNYFRKIIK